MSVQKTKPVKVGKKKTKLDKKSRITVIASISVIAVCIVVIAATLLMQFLNTLQRGNMEPMGSESFVDEPLPDNPFSDKVVNFLLCGVDSDSTPGRDHSLPDVIIVASFNMEENKVSMLQIPRDTFVGDKVPTGKINAVYSTAAQGNKANSLIRTIYSMFQIPIDYYVVTTMDALKLVVDEVGGFMMDVPASINLDGVHVDKGIQLIDGQKAAAIIRNRYPTGSKTEYYYNGGDVRRLETQQILIKAFVKKVLSSKFSLISSILPKVYDKLQTNLSLNDLKNYVGQAMKLDIENLSMSVTPGNYTTHNGLSIYNVNKSGVLKILNDFFRPFSEPLLLNDLVGIPYGAPDQPKDDNSSSDSSTIEDSSTGADSSSDSSSEDSSGDSSNADSSSGGTSGDSSDADESTGGDNIDADTSDIE